MSLPRIKLDQIQKAMLVDILNLDLINRKNFVKRHEKPMFLNTSNKNREVEKQRVFIAEIEKILDKLKDADIKMGSKKSIGA